MPPVSSRVGHATVVACVCDGVCVCAGCVFVLGVCLCVLGVCVVCSVPLSRSLTEEGHQKRREVEEDAAEVLHRLLHSSGR